MSPELTKEIIVGSVAAAATALFTGIPSLALFWWTWNRDQERLTVQKLVSFAQTVRGNWVRLKDGSGTPLTGIVIRNRSLFPVHVSAVGFEIDGELIQLEHPAFPVKMKPNPDPHSNRPNIPDPDVDVGEIASGMHTRANVFDAGDSNRLKMALTAASKKYGVSMEELINTPRVIAVVALETGKMFTSMPLSRRIWRRALAIKREMDGHVGGDDDDGSARGMTVAGGE